LHSLTELGVKIDKFRIINLKLSNYIVIIFLICFSVHLNGQSPRVPKDKKELQVTGNMKQSTADSLRQIAIVNSQKDTIPSGTVDTSSVGKILTDSTFSKVSEPNEGVKISDEGLDDIIDYGSTDSSFIDVKEKQIHLFGNAFVKYKQYDLKAGYIIFDFEKSEASAFQLEDKLGVKTQKPDFTDGTNTFKSTGLRFNFETSKGLIFDAITQEGEFTIHGSRTKFVSKDSDSTIVNDQIYNEHARLTTCNAE